MKTKEELNALKEEFDVLNKKMAELSPEELQEVIGGVTPPTLDLPDRSWGNYKQVPYCPICGALIGNNPQDRIKHMKEVHDFNVVLE